MTSLQFSDVFVDFQMAWLKSLMMDDVFLFKYNYVLTKIVLGGTNLFFDRYYVPSSMYSLVYFHIYKLNSF